MVQRLFFALLVVALLSAGGLLSLSAQAEQEIASLSRSPNADSELAARAESQPADPKTPATSVEALSRANAGEPVRLDSKQDLRHFPTTTRLTDAMPISPVSSTTAAPGTTAAPSPSTTAAPAPSTTAAPAPSTTASTVPASTSPTDTVIYPGESIQQAVDANPAGTTFTIKTGVHRLQQVKPKDGQSFVGESGAVMSGARLLTSFVKEGSYWVVSGQTQQGQRIGMCEAGYGACMFPEDLFLDDAPLRQVTSLGQVAAGKWFFDYGADKIYFADNPADHKVEVSVSRWAFHGDATNVTIKNLIIEKYANPAQHGAIHPVDGTDGPLSVGWVVENNEVRLNHGIGIRTGDQIVIRGNNVHHNSELGVGGTGDHVLVENNTIAYNNTAGFSIGWEAGGTKFAATTDLIVRNNYVHHNRGPGLWTDGNNIRTLYEGNRVVANDDTGIFHEISYDAIIRNNIVEGNGFKYARWLYGAGILVAHSSNVEVYGNTVTNNANGITGIDQGRTDKALYGPHELRNLSVHDNIITMTQGLTGVAQDISNPAIFTDRNIQFDYNTYNLPSDGKYLAWMNATRTIQEWQTYGNDIHGTFNHQ